MKHIQKFPKGVTRRVGKHTATVKYQARANGKDRVVVTFTRGPMAGTKRERMVSTLIDTNPSLNPRKIVAGIANKLADV